MKKYAKLKVKVNVYFSIYLMHSLKKKKIQLFVTKIYSLSCILIYSLQHIESKLHQNLHYNLVTH